MLGFGHLGRARQETRRLLAAIGVAFLLGVQALSTITIVHEADHDCCGEDCPVCAELQQCMAYFQLTGSGLEPEPLRLDQPTADEALAPVAAIEPIHPTLVSLKVRLDE